MIIFAAIPTSSLSLNNFLFYLTMYPATWLEEKKQPGQNPAVFNGKLRLTATNHPEEPNKDEE